MNWDERERAIREEVKNALARPCPPSPGNIAWDTADMLTPLHYADILALADERFRECYLTELEFEAERGDAITILTHRIFELLLDEADREVKRQMSERLVSV